MFVRRLLCCLPLMIISAATDSEQQVHSHIPFFIMKPRTIINQTLHSYCKEQVEFSSEPMFINLTEWPSGLIYARNPQQNFNSDEQFLEECTMELRAPIGDRIRLVFYPIDYRSEDYEQDDDRLLAKAPCLRIRDTDETVIIDCPLLPTRSHSTPFVAQQSEDHLSHSHLLTLEVILPSPSVIEDSLHLHQFKLFFTTFTPKLHVARSTDLFVCPRDHLIDCEDAFCVHSQARCNGISDCRSRVDEESCVNPLRGHARTLFSAQQQHASLCIIVGLFIRVLFDEYAPQALSVFSHSPS